MVSIVERLTVGRLAFLFFVSFFVVLLVAGATNFYAVYDILFRFREASATVTALSVSLIIFPFISVPAVVSIVERAEKLNIRVNPSLMKEYVDGCFIVLLLSTVELVLTIAIQLTEGNSLLTLVAFALLLTLISVFLLVIYRLWVALSLAYFEPSIPVSEVRGCSS